MKKYDGPRKNPNHNKTFENFLGCVVNLTIKKVMKIFFGPIKTLMIANFHILLGCVETLPKINCFGGSDE